MTREAPVKSGDDLWGVFACEECGKPLTTDDQYYLDEGGTRFHVDCAAALHKGAGDEG